MGEGCGGLQGGRPRPLHLLLHLLLHLQLLLGRQEVLHQRQLIPAAQLQPLLQLLRRLILGVVLLLGVVVVLLHPLLQQLGGGRARVRGGGARQRGGGGQQRGVGGARGVVHGQAAERLRGGEGAVVQGAQLPVQQLLLVQLVLQLRVLLVPGRQERLVVACVPACQGMVARLLWQRQQLMLRGLMVMVIGARGVLGVPLGRGDRVGSIAGPTLACQRRQQRLDVGAVVGTWGRLLPLVTEKPVRLGRCRAAIAAGGAAQEMPVSPILLRQSLLALKMLLPTVLQCLDEVGQPCRQHRAVPLR